MKPNYHQIDLLPLKLVNGFQKTLNLKDILLNLHKVARKYFQYQVTTANYNLNAFLAIDKCRKVAQLKEDAFLKQVTQKIKDYHYFLTRKTDTPQHTHKPTSTELSKFAQLFHERKCQLAFLQTILQKISTSLQCNQKDILKNSNTLQKMKNIISEIEQSLDIVINKVEQNINVQRNCQLKSGIKQTGKMITKSTRQRSNEIAAKTVILKVDDGTITNDYQQKINQQQQQQIQALKSQYRRLNCKQQWNQIDKVSRRNRKQTTIIRFCTQPDEDTEEEKNKVNANDNKQQQNNNNISAFKRQRTTKHNTFFSKFGKSTKSTSVLLSQSEKHNYDQLCSKVYGSLRKKLYIKGETKQRSILNKKPSAQSLFETLTKSNPANSFYTTSNFYNDENKRKSFDSRVSTAKAIRKSIQNLDEKQKRKSLLKRSSQGQSRSSLKKKDTPRQQVATMQFLCVDKISDHYSSSQWKLKTTQKIVSNLQIKQDQNEQKQQDEMDLLKQFGTNKQKGLKKRSRRNGLYKNIESGDDTEREQVLREIGQKRKSSIWRETQDQSQEQRQQQNPPNDDNQSLTKMNLLKKSMNQYRNITKLIYKNSGQICESQQDGNNDIMSSQKTIQTTTNILGIGKTKKYIKGNVNAVDIQDCAQLYKQIAQQWKQDKQQLFSWNFQNMMRKKYDRNFKPQESNGDEFQVGESNNSYKKKIIGPRVIESEVTVDNYRRQKWVFSNEGLVEQIVEYGRLMAAREMNALGQRSMEDDDKKKNNKWNSTSNKGQQQDLETLYI